MVLFPWALVIQQIKKQRDSYSSISVNETNDQNKEQIKCTDINVLKSKELKKRHGMALKELIELYKE